jgi:two-component system CheB/CheR fusion protein
MLLFKDSYEVDVLSKELLIGVTRFFRDDDAFAVMKDKVIPDIVAKSKEENMIRVWVAACSSGEEAYSMAILLADEIYRQGLKREVKVFATDINQDAISEASAGVYSDEIVHDIPSNLLAKYFTQRPMGGYQVTQNIRHSVVFATHNMIVDPPFSNLDLVTCRNVLIYFQQSAQKRVLSSLHFALNKNGYLFLGSSENLGDLSHHFKVVSERQRIFYKTSDARLPIHSANTLPVTGKKANAAIPSVASLMKNYRGQSSSVASISFANETLITEYVPPCVLLNDDLQAIHVYGDVANFVKRLPPGRISTEIGDMVNDDISIAVMSAIQRAKQKSEMVYYTDMHTQGANGVYGLNLRVKYVKEHDLPSAPGYYWVVFEEENTSSDSKAKPVSYDAAQQAKQRIEDLELELKVSKEHLQVTVEELETTNEELQSANEELMSANEELQSTNEELQSVNEELYTVNSEYQEKIAEISQANGDLDEVLGLAKIGIIFLDENMLIRRYTDAVKAYVNLVETDVNRPLHHISQNISYDNMLKDVATVFNTGDSIENEITLPDKKLLRVTINSYSYNDVSQSKGVAIVFSDISRVKYMEMGMAVAYKQLRSSVNNALDMLDTKPFSKKLNVLLLDDNKAALKLLSENLRNIDSYECSTLLATDISQAIELVSENEVDICISDYYLNNESALDFIDALKARRLDIPVIVTTGNLTEQLSPILLSHGALDLIEKEDITPALLDKSMRYAVRRQQIDQHIESMISTNLDKPSNENKLV